MDTTDPPALSAIGHRSTNLQSWLEACRLLDESFYGEGRTSKGL